MLASRQPARLALCIFSAAALPVFIVNLALADSDLTDELATAESAGMDVSEVVNAELDQCAAGGEETPAAAVGGGLALFGELAAGGGAPGGVFGLFKFAVDECKKTCTDFKEVVAKAKRPWCFDVCAKEYPPKTPEGDWNKMSIRLKYRECTITCQAMINRTYRMYCERCTKLYPNDVPPLPAELVPGGEAPAAPPAAPPPPREEAPPAAPPAAPEPADPKVPPQAPAAEPTPGFVAYVPSYEATPYESSSSSSDASVGPTPYDTWSSYQPTYEPTPYESSSSDAGYSPTPYETWSYAQASDTTLPYESSSSSSDAAEPDYWTNYWTSYWASDWQNY